MVSFVVIWTLKLDGSHLYKGICKSIKTQSQMMQKYTNKGQINVSKSGNNFKSTIHLSKID
jgi:hypothetical protein